MRKLLITTALFLTAATYAGGGHFHGKQTMDCSGTCDAKNFKEKGKLDVTIDHLIEQRALDSSWKTLIVKNVFQNTFGRSGIKGYSVLVAKSEAASEAEQKCIDFKTDGYVLGIRNFNEATCTKKVMDAASKE